MLGTKEFYELMNQFEKDTEQYNPEKENKDMWAKSLYYCNGSINKEFKLYFLGYANAKGKSISGYFD